MPPDMLKGIKPEFIAPLVGVLTAKNVSNLLLIEMELTSRDPTSTDVSLNWVLVSSPKSDGKDQEVSTIHVPRNQADTQVQSGILETIRSLLLPSRTSGRTFRTSTTQSIRSTRKTVT
jgi:hypothetical protein